MTKIYEPSLLFWKDYWGGSKENNLENIVTIGVMNILIKKAFN